MLGERLEQEARERELGGEEYERLQASASSRVAVEAAVPLRAPAAATKTAQVSGCLSRDDGYEMIMI